MTINKKILVIILTACFFLNTTVVLAKASYIDVDNSGARIVSLEDEIVKKERERLQKKFSGMKEWIQEATPYKNFVAKNRTFLKFRDGLTKFFHEVRSKLDEQWNRRFTAL